MLANNRFNLVVLIAIAALVSTGTHGVSQSSVRDAISVGSAVGGCPASVLSESYVDSATSNEYSSILHSGIDTVAFGSEASTAAKIYSSFQMIATNQEFSTLCKEAGAANFTFSTRFNTLTGVVDASFGFNQVLNRMTIQTFWEVNLVTSVVSGPTVLSHPAATASVEGSTNWGGFQYWIKGTPALASAYGDQNVATTSVPPQGNGGKVIPDEATWIGLQDKSNPGRTLQTGVVSYGNDQAAGYEAWWEFVGTTYMEYYSPAIFVTPGTEIMEGISNTGGNNWQFGFEDLTTGVLQFQPYTVTTSYTPYYADFIVEATTIGGAVQQIAKYSPAINFYDDEFCTGEQETGSCGTAISDSSYNIWQLTQYQGVSNLAEVLNQNGYGGYYDHQGYVTETWETSTYNYNYAQTGA